MNHLSKETSPYLLQHKDNPVDWYPWNDEAWQKAKRENKLVLVSIGYSACHWCHVMEHEVFEDAQCARWMNKYFICIKVDREERPDVDGVYMDAVQLMGRQGGWPLNVFTLPDARPVFGGTYFPKERWLSVLENLQELFETDLSKMLEYASKLHDGLKEYNLINSRESTLEFSQESLDYSVESWLMSLDYIHGGSKGSPKFPMPNNWEFLLSYGVKTGNEKVLQVLHTSLEKMALGGIYDQVGGGFARYSVDNRWKVPHFEKMLYDNAQLISLYAQSYRYFKDELFLQVVEQSLEWAELELKSEEGLFYSALDADSEGEEGKYYVWNEQELREVLGIDFEFCKKYYSIGKEAKWDEGKNILLRTRTDETFAEEEGMSLDQVEAKAKKVCDSLREARSMRVRPRLDNKCLTSWNALMMIAYCEAYKAFGRRDYLQKADSLAEQIMSLMGRENSLLWHVRTVGHSRIPAFLDSYAFMAEALLSLYESGGEERWLYQSDALVKRAIELFYDSSSALFFYSSFGSEQLLSQKIERHDNVLPSSNSSMCKVLFRLSLHLDNPEYEEMSKKMLRTISLHQEHPSTQSNWLQAYMWIAIPFHQIVISGSEAEQKRTEFYKKFVPNSLVAASTSHSELPLLLHRFREETTIYVCTGKMCHAPLKRVEDIFPLII